MHLLSSRPEKRSSSLGARQKMMESRRNVKVRFTFRFRGFQFCQMINGSVTVEFKFQTEISGSIVLVEKFTQTRLM